MGAEHSVQSPMSISIKTLSQQRSTSSWQHLHLSNQRLIQIYHNVIAVEGDHLTEPYERLLNSTGTQYLDEISFQQHFALSNDVSSEFFKAFDRDDDGAMDWRQCLAGLTLCGDASVQQKCVLILSIFDLNQRATILTKDLHHVVATSLIAAHRICQVAGAHPNEVHINSAAVTHNVLEEILESSEHENGSIAVSNLVTLLEENRSLREALGGLGLIGNHGNQVNTREQQLTAELPSSPMKSHPTSSNGIYHTFVWANVFPNHPSMPWVRSRHAACHYDNQIYIHGGRNGNTTLKDFWKFDLATNIWTQLDCGGDTPPPLQEHSMVADNGKLYLFGGDFGFPDLGEIPLWIFNIAAKTWEKQEIKSEVKTPCGRRGHTAIITHNAMHLYGGYVDLKGSVGEFWSLDFESCWWHLNPENPYLESPVARHLHSAVVYDNAMWVYGGINNLQPLKDLWKWDFSVRMWSRIKFWSGPPALYGHCSVISHDAMLIFGGQDSDGAIRNNLWRFHFGSQSWQKVISYKGLIPPPSTRHILLSSIATIRRDSLQVVGEPNRPHSAPHPFRERKVAPLLPVCEQIQNEEIRPHSSPPCVTMESDFDSKTQRKTFRNRIHPSASEDINIPRLKDSKTPSISPTPPSRELHSASAISSAMQPKQLFIQSKRLSSSPKRHSKFSNDKTPLLEDSANVQEVLCYHNAPDILILEDVSDESSEDTAPEESAPEEAEFEQLQISPSQRCNNSLVSYHNEQSALPLVYVHDSMTPYHGNNNVNLNKTKQINSESPEQLHQTHNLKSAMNPSLLNNLDSQNSKYPKSVLPDKNLNYKYASHHQTRIPETVLLANGRQTADLQPSMQHQERSNNMQLIDQNSQHMQGEQGHQYKESTVNIKQTQNGQNSEQNKTTSITVQEYQPKEPYEQIHSLNRNQHSVSWNTATQNKGQANSNGAIGTRPKLHGRSKTSQGLLLLDKPAAGGAQGLNRQRELKMSSHAEQEPCASNVPMCLILLGGQETTKSNLHHMNNPITMWKCHVIPGKPSKKEVQQLLSQ